MIKGGGLVVPKVRGFNNDLPQDSAFSFGDGVSTVTKQIEERWVAVYAVGSLNKANGFTDPQQAAEVVLTCMTESESFYSGFAGRTDLGSEATTVAGDDAWVVDAEIRVDDPQVTVEGDVAKVLVVDTGDPSSFGLFVSVVPIGDQALIDQQQQVADGLTLQ